MSVVAPPVSDVPQVSGRPVAGIANEVVEQLKAALGSKLASARIVRPRLVEVVIDRGDLIPVCTYLKDTLGFEHLSCITTVDWKDRFESVYHIENYYNGCMVQVNARIPYDDPKIESLTGLWHAANYHEREAWDLMGITFEGHPNLERILLPVDFKFHPLRKSFAQEVDRQYITRRKLRGGK
jgi:NADH:ubiquinone oxidoreductase subunit C